MEIKTTEKVVSETVKTAPIHVIIKVDSRLNFQYLLASFSFLVIYTRQERKRSL